MSGAQPALYLSPTIEVTERSDGHLMPFLVAVALFLASTVISLLITGLPH